MTNEELDTLVAELLTTVTIGTGQVTPLRRRAADAITALRTEHAAALARKDQEHGKLAQYLRDEMGAAMADAHATGFAEAIRLAADACQKVRNRLETTDGEATGAMVCASDILTLKPAPSEMGDSL